MYLCVYIFVCIYLCVCVFVFVCLCVVVMRVCLSSFSLFPFSFSLFPFPFCPFFSLFSFSPFPLPSPPPFSPFLPLSCISVCLAVRLSVCLSVCLSGLSVCLSSFPFPSLFLFVNQSYETSYEVDGVTCSRSSYAGLCVSVCVCCITHRLDTVALLPICFPCFQTCHVHLTIFPTHLRWLKSCHKMELHLTW